MRFERNQILLAKLEAEAGTDILPTAADAIKCGIIDVEVDGRQLNDPSVRGSISAEPRRFVNKTVRISVPVAVKGSGAAGTAPEISSLLQSCALKQTIVEEAAVPVKVEYNPINKAADMKTSTIYAYKDGLLIKAVGCMGELTFVGQSGEFAMFTFAMQGKFLDAGDATNPTTPTYDPTEPVEVKDAGFAFGAWADAVARTFGFSTGNNLVMRGNVNAVDGMEPFIVTARDPQWNARIEAVLEATNSFWNDYKERETVALAFTHGSAAGNIVEFAGLKANFDAPRFESEDSINLYSLAGQLLETTAEDNFKLTFK